MFASIGICNNIFACQELNLQSNINRLQLALSFGILAASSLVCPSQWKVLERGQQRSAEDVALVGSWLSQWHYCSVRTKIQRSHLFIAKIRKLVLWYSLRILIIDVVDFLCNVWPFILFKILIQIFEMICYILNFFSNKINHNKKIFF
jgi:hypothetical protein